MNTVLGFRSEGSFADFSAYMTYAFMPPIFPSLAWKISQFFDTASVIIYLPMSDESRNRKSFDTYRILYLLYTDERVSIL